MEAIAVHELEDDVFFADISKQISLLIMDDEEDLLANSPSVSLQAFSQSIHPAAPQAAVLPFGVYYEQTMRRESKGTGVFIPRSSQPIRRKNRQGRNNSSKTQKSQENPRGINAQVGYSTNNKAAQNYDLRKF